MKLNKFAVPASLFAASLVPLSVFRIAKSYRYFYGDDYLLLEAHNKPGGYANSFLHSFIDIDMQGKWRPVFTFVLYAVSKIFGLNTSTVMIVLLLLISVVATVSGLIVYRLNGNFLAALIVAVIVPMSRFSWYAQNRIHGLLELMAILFMLLGCLTYARAVNTGFTGRHLFLLNLFFSLAALTHERYLIVCIVTPLWLVLTNWNYKKSTYFILWGTTVIYIAVELLSQNNPLRGGGEEEFSRTYGLWILDHFVLALKKLLFGTDGNSIYPNHQIFGPLRIAVVLILCVVVYFCVRKVIGLNNAEFADSKIANRDRNKFYSFIYFQFLISGCLILMASTVKSRIEGRWLFGSEILLLIVVCSIIGVLREKRLTVLYLCLIVFAYVANNICNLNNIDKFEVNRAEVNNVLLQVSSMDKPLAAYNVSLIGFNGWVFAYGSVFNQIEHPPNNISFDGNCDTPCLQIKEDNGNTIVTWQS